MGPRVSTLKLLGRADFGVSPGALPPIGRGGVRSIFKTDPAALAIAEVILDALQAHGCTVSSPKREGRGSVWFRCELADHDAGISVMVSEGGGESIAVHVVACELPKTSRDGQSSVSEARWEEASKIITEGISGHFGMMLGFEWLGQPFQEPPHRHDSV